MCLSAERNQFYATKYLNAHEKFKKQMAAAYILGGWNQNGIHRKIHVIKMYLNLRLEKQRECLFCVENDLEYLQSRG